MTVKAVLQALSKVKSAEGLPQDVPVIVLGGEGFIGSALRMSGNGNFYSFDALEEKRFLAFSEKMKGEPAVLLNITKKGALGSYTPYIWPGVVVLNEVYPEPNGKEVAEIKTMGASCYQIIGVKGKAWPKFPRGYEGGIPCCASFLPDGNKEGAYDVLIKKL